MVSLLLPNPDTDGNMKAAELVIEFRQKCHIGAADVTYEWNINES
jgi:hypothetical protein